MKTELSLPDAERIARGMVGALKPFCRRVEIAGSIRRRKSVIGDIEIVCIPEMEPVVDMFGVVTGEISKLERIDWSLYGRVLMNGERMKKLILREGVQLDLFITTWTQFGYIWMVRTGPRDFSRKMVTDKRAGGYKPGWLKCHDGSIWSRNHTIETPDEIDVFELYGMQYLEPWKRK